MPGIGPVARRASGLVLLEQHTASSSATLDFTTCISAAYDEYQIEIVGLVAASASDLWMRMSTNGGATYDASAVYSYDHFVFRSGGSGVGGNSGQAQMVLSFSNGGHISTSTTMGFNASLKFLNPGSAALYKNVFGDVVYQDDVGPYRIRNLHSGRYESTTAVNAFRFLLSTGNIASGIIRVYGVSKT